MAYARVREYRDLGPTRRVDDMPNVARTSVQRWSRRWRRAERCHGLGHRGVATRRRPPPRPDPRDRTRTTSAVARALLTAGPRALQNLDALDTAPGRPLRRPRRAPERAALLGDRMAVPPVMAVPDDDDLSPLERIARELAGTA